jgi:hypothetical protein
MSNVPTYILRAEELELLVVGGPQLNFLELEQSTEYEGYTNTDPVV